MRIIDNKGIINLMQRTLDCVDERLHDHGKRVAFMVFKMLKLRNIYSEKQLRDICILSLLHDIGAYKTEEINKLVEFETNNVWEHSIYGFLFLKYFSPLKDLAPVVFFHHANCQEINYLDSSQHELAQAISLCDRADIFSQTSGGNILNFKSYVEKHRNVNFSSDIIDLFFETDLKFPLTAEEIDSSEEFSEAIYGVDLTAQEINSYLEMIVLSIDFRSYQTAIHTMAASYVAATLAELANLSQEDTEEILAAAMIHDLGKTAIPIEILENPNRLTEPEMNIMKTHVDLTEKIVSGTVADRIAKIALRHHEKLNGTGYPKGLKADELSLSERIFAVADIFSALCGTRSYKAAFPKEKVVGILTDMAQGDLVDSGVVSLAVGKFDYIMEKLTKESQPIIDMYNTISREYLELLEKVNNLNPKSNDFSKLF